ncbi:MAG: hypothetical protein Q7Q71_07865 [Verrucomicrobiota bacterium JB023]|nr:hypothetical protein [Verrucomicrobiota bacterium JB023]
MKFLPFSLLTLFHPLLVSSLPAGVITVETTVQLSNPDILAYNVGHFVPGTNAQDFWRYSGVNGARMFLSPGNIEPDDDIPGIGDGVTDLDSFLTRRAALRADPLNEDFIDWPDFIDQYENNLTGNSSGGNRFYPSFALAELRKLDIEILVQITGSERSLPIANDEDWAGKWEFWQHYYAQAFYLAREFDVERYQMFNEPNHPNADGLTQANWLMRLQLASDAIQNAVADVNAHYGKSLTPLVYGPVNSGGDAYQSWGSVGVRNRHTNFLGETDPDYLVMHRYDYHQYNSSPSGFASELNDMRADIAADMAPETRFRMSISEFNVHTNGTFDTIPETLDTPEKYTRLGAISARLAQNFEKELYCFKFAQTPNSNANYPVSKNGMHYVNNTGEPYTYGGATRAAEVWRLFNKALQPGGNQLRFDRDADGSVDDLEIRVTHVPEENNYYIFLANEGGNAQITIDTSAWNIPADTPFLLEQVSESYYGTVRRWGTVAADGTLNFNPGDNDILHNSDTVFLITVPAVDLEEEEVIEASFDATITDGVHADTSFASTTTLLARNDPDSVDQRSAALIQFTLPPVYPPDIQLAVLSVEGRTHTEGATVQGHLYGLDNDAWSGTGAVTWQTAPNLQTNVPAGKLIANRFIAEQGDSAHLQGQFVFNRTDYRTRMVDVTAFLQSQTDGKASFLLSQDPRWDITLPSLEIGDTQVDGLDLVSTEGGTSDSPGPRLRLVRRMDRDQDGISDFAEENVFSTNPELADEDGDGLSDGEEILLHGTDPHLADSDGDGMNDGDETIAGTDPLDSASTLHLRLVERSSDGAAVLEWDSVDGRRYDLHRTFSLQTGDWGSPISQQTGNGSPLRFTDTEVADWPTAFYQLQVEAPGELE